MWLGALQGRRIDSSLDPFLYCHIVTGFVFFIILKLKNNFKKDLKKKNFKMLASSFPNKCELL